MTNDQMTNRKSEIENGHYQLITDHCPLVLTGFMGVGKTSVGKILARKLEREFVDMDAVIEAREGIAIREVFASRGEAYFRQVEAAVCVELAARENVVIATGGGALVNAPNRAAFANALIICLDANLDAILARIGDATDRPMLAGDERRARIQALMELRQPAYAQIATHLDTTGKSPDEIADEIIALLELKR